MSDPLEANVVFGPGIIPNFDGVATPPIGALVEGEQLATEAYDVGMATESPIAELTTDPNTIVFYVNSDTNGKHAVAYDVNGLIGDYNSHNFVYECIEKKEAASVGNSADTKGNASIPYYKIELLGGVLVPVKQLLVALKSGHRHWLLRNKTRLEYTVSYRSFVNPAIPMRTVIDPDTQLPYPNAMLGASSERMFPINYDNEPIFGESASICKQGYDAYSIFPVATPDGSVDEDEPGPFGVVPEELEIASPNARIPPPISSSSTAATGRSQRSSISEAPSTPVEEEEELQSSSGSVNIGANVSQIFPDMDMNLVASLLFSTGALALTLPLPKRGPTVLGRFGSAVAGAAGKGLVGLGGLAGTGISGLGAGLVGLGGIAGRGASSLLGAFSTPSSGPMFVVPRPPREPPPEGPRNPHLDPAIVPDLTYLMRRPAPPPVVDVEAKPAIVEVKPGDLVSTYVVWGNKLLIFKDKVTGTLSVPNGSVIAGQPSFVEAAISILKEQMNPDPMPETKNFTVFKQTKEADVNTVLFYSTFLDKPKVQGSDVMDASFNFGAAALVGEKAEADGVWWASIGPLRIWLNEDKNAAFRTQDFVNALRDLSKTLDIKVGVNEDELRELPAWSKNLFDSADISTSCKASEFVTSDCMAKTVRKDIFLGHDESRYGRLVKRVDEPELVEYIRLQAAMKEETDPMKKAQIKMKLYYGYPGRTIYIRDPSNNKIHRRTVPNPYRALSYREDEVTTFANPAGGLADPVEGVSTYDDRGTMRAQNIQLLKELVPNQIVADKAMSIAILESLWYCGQNPTLSNDPRCFPARLLGELREYQADKVQRSQAVEAKAVLEKSEWPALKLMLAMLKQTIAGSYVYPFREDLFPPKSVIAPHIPVDASGNRVDASGNRVDASGNPVDASGNPIVASGNPVVASGTPVVVGVGVAVPTAVLPKPTGRTGRPAAAAMPTNVRIVPRQIGGGIHPILPRGIGIPPLVRT